MEKSIKIIFVVFLGLFLAVNFASASTTTGQFGQTGMSTGINGTVIAAPTASPVAGTYTSAQSVVLTASGSSSIYYTTDGSAPTCSTGTVYSSAISVSTSQTINAISCYPNSQSSSVASFAYVINISNGTTTYAVTFNSNGGTPTPASITGVASGATVTLPTAPTETGYTFAGWFTVATGGTAFDATTPVTADITVYAQWTAITTPAPTGGGGGGGGIITTPTPKVGDITGDGVVDELDFSIMMSQWGQTGTNLSADLNKDGVVDELDFSILMANWS